MSLNSCSVDVVENNVLLPKPVILLCELFFFDFVFVIYFFPEKSIFSKLSIVVILFPVLLLILLKGKSSPSLKLSLLIFGLVLLINECFMFCLGFCFLLSIFSSFLVNDAKFEEKPLFLFDSVLYRLYIL